MVSPIKIFLDSSVLIEYIKGNKTDLLESLFNNKCHLYINHIVFSEFLFHFLSLMSGKSPLTLKNASIIGHILTEHKPIEFINNFNLLEMNQKIMKDSYTLMKEYNTLPNDALIFSTCKFHRLKYIASFDSDFSEICKKGRITLIDSIQALTVILDQTN